MTVIMSQRDIDDEWLEAERRRIQRPAKTLPELRVARAVRLASAATGVPVEAVEGHGRDAEYVEARWLAWWMLARLAGVSRAKIGRAFGRDHTSVMYGLRKLEQRRDIDPVLASMMRALADEWRVE